MNHEIVKAKARELYEGMRIGFNMIYGICAIYGAYQLMLNYEKVAIALNIIAKK